MTHTITYKNWRGEVSTRRIRPIRVWFGNTSWHPGEFQYLLEAFDEDKQANRDFAILDIQQPPVSFEEGFVYVRYEDGCEWYTQEGGSLRLGGTINLPGSHHPLFHDRPLYAAPKPVEIAPKPPPDPAEADEKFRRQFEMIGPVVDSYLAAHPAAVEDYRGGKKAALNAIIGKIMGDHGWLRGDVVKAVLEAKINAVNPSPA